MSRLGTTGRTLQEGSLYGLLFLLPFSKAAIEILFVVMLIGWVFERLDPATRHDTVWARPTVRPLLIALGGFMTVCALSITVSEYPAQSLRALFSKWLEYLLLMVIAADLGSRQKVVARSAMVIAASAVPVLIEGVSQELFGRGVFRGYRIDMLHGSMYARMIGPYESPIDLAIYLMVTIPLVLSCSVMRKGWLRWGLGALCLALFLCLVRTASAGAWVSLAIGLLVLLVAHRATRRTGLTLMAACALTGGFLLQRDESRLRSFFTNDIGVRDRWVMWQAALGMIRDRPILGHGVNTFMAHYLDYWVGGERQPRYAHNCYLQMAAETGIVGLALFVTVLGLMLRRVLRGVHQRDGPERLILLGLGVALVSFIVQAGVDTNFYGLRQAALFWTLAGLALGLSSRAPGSASSRTS